MTWADEAKQLHWFCEQCGGMHKIGEHYPPSADFESRCEFTAGSLYCVRPNCPNPRHRHAPAP